MSEVSKNLNETSGACVKPQVRSKCTQPAVFVRDVPANYLTPAHTGNHFVEKRLRLYMPRKSIVPVMRIVSALFRAHRDAPWAVYIPVAVVSVLFGLWSTEDGRLIDTAPYAALLILSVVQMRYRTLLGWAALLLACVAYAVAVLVTPRNGSLGEYFVFALAGLIPAVVLAIGYPLRRRERASGT